MGKERKTPLLPQVILTKCIVWFAFARVRRTNREPIHFLPFYFLLILDIVYSCKSGFLVSISRILPRKIEFGYRSLKINTCLLHFFPLSLIPTLYSSFCKVVDCCVMFELFVFLLIFLAFSGNSKWRCAVCAQVKSYCAVIALNENVAGIFVVAASVYLFGGLNRQWYVEGVWLNPVER